MVFLGRKHKQAKAQPGVALVRVAFGGLALLASLCTMTSAHAWLGVVTHVSDGDTVWVQPLQGGEAFKVRLEGIDAPEICQPWGPQARAALYAVLQGQVVDVQGHARDNYGRLLAKLSRQGHDVGAWMVGQGYAWSYSFQHHAGVYDAQQALAQTHRLGLFADARALQPRWFRKRFGSCHTPGN